MWTAVITVIIAVVARGISSKKVSSLFMSAFSFSCVGCGVWGRMVRDQISVTYTLNTLAVDDTELRII